MGGLTGFVIFIVIVVIPAYYLNKWMLKTTKPRESFKNLLLYLTLSIVIAVSYTALFIFIITSIYPLPKK